FQLDALEQFLHGLCAQVAEHSHGVFALDLRRGMHESVGQSRDSVEGALSTLELFLGSYTKNVELNVVDVESNVVSSPELKKKWYDFLFKTQPQWVVAFSLVFSFLFLALVLMTASRKSIKAISNVEDAVSRVGQNMAGSSAGANARNRVDSAASLEDRNNFKTYLGDLKTESLLEMLADCYWTHNDSYASGLWNAMSATQRREVAKATAWTQDYAEHLLTVKPQFYSRFYSPYYLKPLNVHKLDQQTLSEAVEKDPDLYNLVSEIRNEYLKISSEKRIEFEMQRKDAISDDTRNRLQGKLDKHSEGAPRAFSSNRMIPLNSIEDESKLLGRKDLGLDIMVRIPTLAWLKYEDKEKLTNELRKYSAQDLAQAWLGPEDVLRYIEELIPEKKMNLVRSYLQRVAEPSRQNPIFEELSRLGIEALIARTMNGQLDSDTSRDEAA
ncbi:MAG: hypothetical protein AAF202_04560, partial [Pseudomonadota bacterium]